MDSGNQVSACSSLDMSLASEVPCFLPFQRPEVCPTFQPFRKFYLCLHRNNSLFFLPPHQKFLVAIV